MKLSVDIARILIAHFIGDFLFQTKKTVENKRDKKWKSKWLYIHSLIYSILIYVALSEWNQAFWLIPALFMTHMLIDRIKSGTQDTAATFIIDQLAHLIILIVIWTLVYPKRITVIISIVQEIWGSFNILAIALGCVLVLWPMGSLIGYLTEPLRKRLSAQEFRGLERAGFWIGCLERVFVYSFIISDYPEGIAFVAAAKSIFRFGEIKDPTKREETEYILIGSLLSIGFAMLIGYAVKSLLR